MPKVVRQNIMRLTSEEANAHVSIRLAEQGWYGRCLGSDISKSTASLVVLVGIAAIVFLLVSHSYEKIELLSSLVTGALGYLFGKETKFK